MSGLEHSRVAAVVDRLKVRDSAYEAAMSYIGHVAAAEDGAAQEAKLEDLEALTERKRRLPILVWVISILAIISLIVSLFHIGSYRRHLSLIGGISSSSILDETEKSTQRYSASEEMILYGDTEYGDIVDRSYYRWRADRGNSAYYLDYCQTYKSAGGSYPSDMIETGSSIDPDNAWYLIASLSALDIRDDSVLEEVKGALKTSDSARPACRVVVYKVNNKKVVDEALALLKRSYSKPILTDRAIELTAKKLEIVTAGRDFDTVTMMEPVTVVSATKTSALNNFDVHSLFSAKFYELSQVSTEADQAEVLHWIVMYRDFVKKSSTQPLLIDQLITMAGMRSVVANMREAAKSAGLRDEVAKISKLVNQLNADKLQMDSRDSLLGSDEFLTKTSILARLATPVIGNKSVKEVKLELDLLTPSRMAEHSLAGRVASWLMGLVLGLVMIIALMHFLMKPATGRKLSSRMLAQLSATDWLIIFGIGVVLPVLLYLCINGVSPWSVRQFGLAHRMPGAMFATQFFGMLFLGITLSKNLLKWRLQRNNNHLVEKPSRFSWGVSLSSFLLMIVAPYLVNYTSVSLSAIGLILAVVMVSLLADLCRFWFGSDARLSKASMNLGMVATLSALIILLQILTIHLHRDEVKWVMQDELFVSQRGIVSWNSYETEVAEQMQKEMKERLNLLD